MSDFEVGVVIPVGPGRHENVELVLEHLARLTLKPYVTVLVLDGPAVEDIPPRPGVEVVHMAHAHEPGMEQPRNVGVRVLRETAPSVTHAWFLDSDVLVGPDALVAYRAGHTLSHPQRPILIGPYEWLPEGTRELSPAVHTDFRWPMFRERGLGPFVAELGVALGCFGGNLVWPIDEFVRIGGFHPQLHHGRCEDGELGLRAASHRIPMGLVAGARGYHLAHAIDRPLAEQRNMRDVPLLNQWHPWVEEQGLIVTDQDGARFDFVCGCGAQVNTLLMWEHFEEHLLVGREDSELILPEGLR